GGRSGVDRPHEVHDLRGRGDPSVRRQAGRVETVVGWRLDRLGKTCSELVKMFEHLAARRVKFISLQGHLDLSTASGRRMAGVLGSIALYETEVPGATHPGRAGDRAGARPPVG